MKIRGEALTFDDVLLIPAYSEINPQHVSLKSELTDSLLLNIPILAAAMDTVCESRLAIALAEEGGMGFIHKNMTIEQQAQEVLKVKKFESGIIDDPITVDPDRTVEELLAITRQYKISGVPVVRHQKLLGIVTGRDIRFETNLTQTVSQVMTPQDQLVTVKEGAKQEEVIALFHKHRIEKVLIVNDDFELRGMITVKDIQKHADKPFACRDQAGQLCVGAAVGVVGETEARIEALVDAGVNIILIDTAHGHSKGVLDRVKWCKQHYPQVAILAGNIATGDAAKALVKAGANALKVGIGPGSICTTRIVTGVGVPQITAIAEVAAAVKDLNIPVIADGGIRFSGDIGKAIAAGASAVMIGSLFAGTEEAPGSVELYQGRSYKTYRGMGSLGAMAQRQGSADRYFQEGEMIAEKLVPEGIEGRVPYKGPLYSVIHQLMGGLRATMGYTGCSTIKSLRTQAEFMKVTAAGMRESHVHDVSITKEAPNYWVES